MCARKSNPDLFRLFLQTVYNWCPRPLILWASALLYSVFSCFLASILLFALYLCFGYTFTRGTQKEQKFFLRVPPTFTVGKYLFENRRVLVPATINDNPTHSTLAESAIFPLPTFTGISPPDGFSFRFGAPKGEMAARHFVLFLRPSFSSGGCGSPLLTLIWWRLSCSSFHIILLSFWR